MEHATAEPTLPVPLPRPLSDPLRVYRRLLLVLLVIGWVGHLVYLLLPSLGGTTRRELIGWAVAGAGFTLWFCVCCILPRRATNALYLRSFRNDARTGGLRMAAQAALGRKYRLSGIRDPRRRWPWLVRHLLYVLFLIRYAQPKYMNLEAGADWKARLWRSLGDARCALIDVTDLTPFVREEVELAVRCLGLHRILFVADDSRTADERRHSILAALESPDVEPARISVALWADTPAGRAAFKDQVRAFAAGLPATPPGLNAAAFPGDTPSPNDPGGNALQGEGWGPFLLANVIGVGLAVALAWGEVRAPDAGLMWFLPALVLNALAALLLLQYFAVCGSGRARFRLGVTFLFSAVFGVLPGILTRPWEGLRSTVARTKSENNLKQIAEAVKETHHNTRLPPSLGIYPPKIGAANNGQDGMLFHLLPYIEQGSASKASLWTDGAREKLRAEDMKARRAAVKVSLGVLLAEYRKDPKSTDEKYRNKWLVVAGKVARVTREPVHDWPALSRSYSTAAASPRADAIVLIIKLEDKPESHDALECACVVATLALPGGAVRTFVCPSDGTSNTIMFPERKGVGEGKSVAGVKEGDSVTLLGKWPPPSPRFPFPFLSRGPCRLIQCELAR